LQQRLREQDEAATWRYFSQQNSYHALNKKLRFEIRIAQPSTLRRVGKADLNGKVDVRLGATVAQDPFDWRPYQDGASSPFTP
jgi:hypothetical protein